MSTMMRRYSCFAVVLINTILSAAPAGAAADKLTPIVVRVFASGEFTDGFVTEELQARRQAARDIAAALKRKHLHVVGLGELAHVSVQVVDRTVSTQTHPSVVKSIARCVNALVVPHCGSQDVRLTRRFARLTAVEIRSNQDLGSDEVPGQAKRQEREG